MVARLDYHDAVLADIEAACLWFESHESGLGRRFNHDLGMLLDRIAANPEAFAIHARRTRRTVLQHFHHIVFFVIESDHVLVTGVFDGRRHPRSWSDRVRDRASFRPALAGAKA